VKADNRYASIAARFGELLEHAPDAMLIIDAGGHIVLSNGQTQRMFGYAPEALVGEPVETLLPPRYRAQHVGHRSSFLSQPRTRPMGAGLELFGQRQTGEEFPVEISLSPLSGRDNGMVMCAVRDMTERHELRRRAERQFRDLLESAPDAMVIVDGEGRIVLVNSQAVALFGWQREELLGQPVDLLVPLRFRGVHPVHRMGFFAHPTPRRMGAGLDLTGLRKDGSEFPVEISLSPIQTETGQLVASAIRDATERQRTEQMLREADRMKREFLANMSHELRTPLNGILGFSELLADDPLGPLSDKQRAYVRDIHGCGKQLLHLIDNLLDLSKAEAGRMSSQAEDFSPLEAVADVCAVLAPLAHKKRLRVQVPEVATVPTVQQDLQKFRQILLNLLSNAIKFTDPGGQVSVELAPVGSDRFLVAVHDTGVGITAEQLGHLFEAFRQVDGGLARRHEGTGLGLALTSKLVEVMQGHIEVRSEPGRGSSFGVTLPRVLPARPPG
jgi:PAS domain S-box-containing protein